ncbi:hypothetical protein [Alkalilacustris brevis]|uniref:hypothetical protein n=1 Tax=Alkalilacustris brevis TaxID=2026338 RepID=UPI000E0E01EE|nr:hypothetical protein [Alkalilacustris brevis]
MDSAQNLSDIASGARAAVALSRAAKSEALASFRFLFLAEAAAPSLTCAPACATLVPKSSCSAVQKPAPFFNKALTQGDAQTLCVVNIDDFGGLGPLYERLRRFSETAPYVPIVLLSFGFRSDDFTPTRLPVIGDQALAKTWRPMAGAALHVLRAASGKWPAQKRGFGCPE